MVLGGVVLTRVTDLQPADDILGRMAPFLGRNAPVDILDLWAGAGLWSSKVHDFLKPRRHVLVEPEVNLYGPLLKQLVAKDPSYELLSMELNFGVDWKALIRKHLPEQGPSCADTSGALAKNDTLLILANPPPSPSKRSHYTPGRWWTNFMDLCIRQAEFHQYGSVRVLATLPSGEAHSPVPRSVFDRKKTSLLTETVALHVFEVASPLDSGTYTLFKGWDTMKQSFARVAERTRENNITITPGRQLPEYKLAPESPETGKKPTPYVRRVRTDRHDRLVEEIYEADMNDTKAKRVRTRALIQLNQENRTAWKRLHVCQKEVQIDELTKTLCREAAKPESTLASLQPYVDELDAIDAVIKSETANMHFDVVESVAILVDDHRSSLHIGSFDSGLLPWDRRAFEPLFLDENELYPRGCERTMIYFEANKNPPTMQMIQDLDAEKRSSLLRLFDALTLIFSKRSALPVTELLALLFPSRPVDDLIHAIPSLTVFARKKPKPDFDDLPKTCHPIGIELGDELDPAVCLQDNMDYDLSKVRLRTLFVKTLWEIMLEYVKTATDLSPILLSRLLGGSMTSYQSGGYLGDPKKMK